MTDKSAQPRVVIFDTTLRDGEQSPGATMTHDEKVEIAGLLDDMGVDIIEAGFPIASEGDFAAVSEIARRAKTSTICGLARANFKDIDRCWEAVRHARSPRIHTFIGTSPLHRAIPNLTMDQMAERIHDTVTHARNLCDNVQWSPMDATRTEHDYLCRVVEIATRYTRVSTNDSVDILVPNSEFVNGRVTNWTFDEFNRRIHVPFGVAYGTDKEKVKAAAVAAAARVDGVIIDDPLRPPDVWLVGFGESSLDFELVVWVTRRLVTAPGRTNAKLLWALDDELRAANIEIPFPQRDLHVRSGSLRVDVDGK